MKEKKCHEIRISKIIEIINSQDGQVLLFSKSRRFIQQLKVASEEHEKIQVGVLDVSRSNEEKEESILLFRNGTIPILILHPKSGTNIPWDVFYFSFISSLSFIFPKFFSKKKKVIFLIWN